MAFYKNAVLHVAGAVSYALAQWLILVFCARSVSVEAAGQYVLFLAFFTPASILFNFGLRNSIASDQGKEFNDRCYVAARLLGVLLFSCFAGGAIFFWGGANSLAALVFLVKMIDGLSEIIYGNWIRHKLGYRYGVSQILRLIVFVVLFFSLVLLDVGGAAALYSYPIAMMLVFACYDSRFSVLDFSGAGFHVWRLIRRSMPLAFGALLIALNSSVPRWIIDWFLGSELLASYAVIMYFISIAAIPVVSFCQTGIPAFSKSSGFLKDRRVRLNFSAVFCYSIGFSLVLYFFGNKIVRIVYGIDYNYSRWDLIFVGMAGGLTFFLCFFNLLLTAKRQFNLLFRGAVFGVVVASLATGFLVSALGLSGAFMAAMIACLASVICVCVFLSRL